MKNKYTLGLVASLFIASLASADVLATWTFETTIPTTGGPLAPEVGTGSATGVTGGTWSNPVGNGTAESWSSNGWDVGDYYQFQVTGTGYDTFEVSWAQISSSTGPSDFSLSYSLDGITYVSVYSYDVIVNSSPNAWSSTLTGTASTYDYIIDLDAVVTGSLYLRLTDTSTLTPSGGTVAATGTSRVDTFSVSGTVSSVPEPSSFAALAGVAALAGTALRRRRKQA